MSVSFVPANVSLWVVSYKRHEEIQSTVNGWLSSFPFEEVNIIDNHGELTADIFDPSIRDKIIIYRNSLRPNWMTGSIAECWNKCMLNAFLQKDWCIMSQDDMLIYPGWAEKIQETEYLTYIAPIGDTITIQSLEGFKQVGWYDENFRIIGGPENDYIFRTLKVLGDRCSLHDEHPWMYFDGDIGLAQHFIRPWFNPEGVEYKVNHDMVWGYCYGTFERKWGESIDSFMAKRNFNTPPAWPDLDWYPSWTIRMRQLGRL